MTKNLSIKNNLQVPRADQRMAFTALLMASLIVPAALQAQTTSPAVTTIQDKVYRSDGTPATGSVVISWNSFVSQDSKPVFGGSKTVTLNNGSLAVALIPNVGAVPSGTSYTVRYYQSGIVFAEEYWVVPTSSPTTPPTSLSVVNIGAIGSTTYCYWVSAILAQGETNLSPAGCTTTGNGTLSSINFNRISWQSVSGATSYRLFRSTTSTTPGGIGNYLAGTTAAPTFDDQSSALLSATVPDVNTTDTRSLQQVRIAVPPSTSIALSANQINGTAIVSHPLGTQTITAPASGGVPLQLRGQVSGGGNILEVFDSQNTTPPKSWFSSSGGLVTSVAPIINTFTPGSILFPDNGGQLSENNSNLFWDNTTSRLRVGPRTGFSPLISGALNIFKNTIANTNPPSGTSTALGMISQSNSAGSYNIGSYSIAESAHSTGNRTATLGAEADAYHTGAGTVGDLIGHFSYADNSAPLGGTVDHVSAASTSAWNSGDATTNEMSGLRILSNGTSGGQINNNFGIKIEDQTAGTNNWAIKTGSGRVEIGGPVTTPSLNNIRYADQYPGANAGAKIAAAIADLPSTGGTVDARGFVGSQAISATLTIDKPVKLLLGKTTFTMTGGATELIKITSPGVEIAGMGLDSLLEVGSGVGATVDAIRVGGTADVDGLFLHDFRIAAQSGAPGRYAINIDNSSFYVFQVQLHRLYLGQLGSYGIRTTNAAPLSNGAMFTSSIRDSTIFGGLNLSNAGDSIRVENNTITGSLGVVVGLVSGARGFVFSGNNVTAAAGLRITSGSQPQIIGNTFEQTVTSTEPNNAVIDIDGGASSRIVAPVIQGNSIGANSSFVADAIRVNYADSALIQGNLTERGSGVAYRITANANSTQIRNDRQEPNGELPSTYLSDAGTKTTHDFIYPGSNGTRIFLGHVSLGSIDRTTTGTTDSDQLRWVGSSFDGTAHIPEWNSFAHVTSNAGASTFIMQNQLDGGGWNTALSINSDAANRRVTFGGSGTTSLLAAAGSVTGTMRTDSGGAVFLGAETNHRTDIITNNAIAASFSTSKNLSLGGLTGGGEQLTLTSTGKVGWDNGVGGVDTSLYRSATSVLKTDGLLSAQTFRTNAPDPADAGAIRLGNGETIASEGNPTGVDGTISFNIFNQWEFNSPIALEGTTVDGNKAVIATADPTGTRTFTLPNANSNPVQPLTCSGTDKVSAISSAGVITCSPDQGGSGSGSGDSLRVEDGDNAGTFTAMTDADFDDSGDIDFQRIAGSPDAIIGVVRPNSVALSTDTTGNYVASIADGIGIDGTANGEGATYTPTLNLTEINSHTFGDNTVATLTQSFDPSGATNPTWSYSNGVANLSSGTLQQAGTAVALQNTTLTAGNGLTGGGDLSNGRTFDVGVTAPIELTADTVACSTCTTATNSQTMTNKTLTTPVIGAFTVAGLPAAGTANRVAIVTDAATAGSCSSGGGAARSWCRDTGSTWEPLGDGGGGGGGGLGDPGANGVVVRTALNTSTNRTITGTSPISVSSGDGVSGNPTISIDQTANYTWNGLQSLGAEVRLSGAITPAQITADQNDYNPTGNPTASVLRISSDASRNITGLQGGSTGTIKVLVNVGGNNIVLANQSASSTAANRFLIGQNITLSADTLVVLRYDGTDSRWRVLARPMLLEPAGGSAGITTYQAGIATTAARADHTHRSIGSMRWFFPGVPSTGVQNATLTLPEGITNSVITDIRVTVNTTSASATTYNIRRCTAACTGSSPTFSTIYSSDLSLGSNTRTTTKGSAPNQNVSGLAGGDQFKVDITGLTGSPQDITMEMTYKYETTN